ncbi:MAG TPA: O-antigen ligase family protein [Phycisphaerales bacterium]|nr:O-antigen ligase family protein [Phycisphaerales bacterium]
MTKDLHKRAMEGDSAASASAGGKSKFASILSWLGAALIVAVSVARCVVTFSPMVVFDVDPAAVGGITLSGLGPAGSLMLDVALLVGCGFALCGWVMSGRKMNWGLLLLAAVPAISVVKHGCGNLGDLWIGMTWLSAILACVTCAHLAGNRKLQIVIIAGLLGALGPVVIRGISQVTREHDATVSWYDAHKTEILASHGWAEDSADARMFERRLIQRQPTGWFTTTNILASLLLVGCVACLGLGIAAYKKEMESGWWGTMFLIAALCACGLAMSGSKGAGMAAFAAIFVMAVCAWLNSRGWKRAGGWIAVACVIAAICGIIVRGTILPESFLGEKSLLFRWHYLQGASGIAMHDQVWGVGPDHFQMGYMAHRPVRSPEEVASAHNVFADWVACLGLTGWAWVVLVMWLIWRTGVRMVRNDEVEKDSEQSRGGLIAVVIAGCAAIALMFVLEARSGIDDIPAWPMIRIAAMLAFLAVTGISAGVMRSVNAKWCGLALGAAAVGLMMHAQIEMTLTQPGAAAWGLCLLGAVAGTNRWKPAAGRTPAASPRNSAGIVVGLGIIASGLALFVLGARSAMKQEQRLITAAREIALVMGDPARDEHGLIHSTVAEQVEARVKASQELVQAFDELPTDPGVLDAAADQLLRAADSLGDKKPLKLLMDAADIAQRAIDSFGERASLNIGIQAASELGATMHDQQAWAKAERWAQRLTDMDPHAIGSWRVLGDVLWAEGKREEAGKAYEHALENNSNFSLDEMKQLRNDERIELERRVKEAKQ